MASEPVVSPMVALYDTIGCGYAGIRKPDPHIAETNGARSATPDSVVNVGAGPAAPGSWLTDYFPRRS